MSSSMLSSYYAWLPRHLSMIFSQYLKNRAHLSLSSVRVELQSSGGKWMMSSPKRALDFINSSLPHPASYAPPTTLNKTVHFGVHRSFGWKIYTVSPKDSSDTSKRRGHVIYLHGGGYVNEIEPTHWQLIAELAQRCGVTVIVPIYTLAPLATAEETVANASQLAADVMQKVGPEHVLFMGDSAGGGLSMAVAQSLSDQGKSQPSRIVLISPWLDATVSHKDQEPIEPIDPFFYRRGVRVAGKVYAGKLDIKDPRVSPIFWKGSLQSLAPITVFTSTRDVLSVDAMQLRDKAREQGVKVDVHVQPAACHVYPLFPTPEGAAAREILCELCRDL